jgi:hypothetical protein
LFSWERSKIEIIVGARVEDKNGKHLGQVNNMVQDSWSGDVKKFSVRTELADTDVFYSPDEVSEATTTAVKLKKLPLLKPIFPTPYPGVAAGPRSVF